MDKGWKYVALIVLVFVVFFSASGLTLYLFYQHRATEGEEDDLTLTSTSPITHNSAGPASRAFAPSVLGNFSRAAVAVDGEPCAKIAK